MGILDVQDIRAHFGSLAAVDGVRFSLEEGEILGIIGPNGAGKTTLFNTIVGVHRPTSGRVLLDGRDITGWKPHRICRLGVAKASQITEPFQSLTVFENVLVAALHGGGLGMAAARSRAEEVIRFVGLAQERHKRSGSISVPGRRRLELARALATGARVLLLDETMAGLNPHEIDEALDLIRSIRAGGKSLLVVEHVMRVVTGISDRIMALNHGSKIAEGDPRSVIEHPEVIEAYLGGKGSTLSNG